MARYIDCEECKDHFHEIVIDIMLSSWDHKPDCIIDAFLSLPKLDVQPVVHAKWIRIKSSDDHESYSRCYSCSNCMYKTLQAANNFCPNCGAKMDGDAK